MLRTFAEAAAEYCAGVEKRVGQSLGKMLVLGVLAGAFIAFAGVAASIAGTVGGKLATAAVFPMGLAMVILGGSELFTGNCLFLLPVLGKKCRAFDAARCWIAVYLANLVGAVAVALLVTGCGVLDGIAEAAIATAAGKASLSLQLPGMPGGVDGLLRQIRRGEGGFPVRAYFPVRFVRV